MEDVLKCLLEAEHRAEALVKAAEAERDRLVRQARVDAHAAEERFAARIPAIRTSFLEKAEEQAAQALAELRRHYAEQQRQLYTLAEAREQTAVETAVALLLDPSRE